MVRVGLLGATVTTCLSGSVAESSEVISVVAEHFHTLESVSSAANLRKEETKTHDPLAIAGGAIPAE